MECTSTNDKPKFTDSVPEKTLIRPMAVRPPKPSVVEAAQKAQRVFEELQQPPVTQRLDYEIDCPSPRKAPPLPAPERPKLHTGKRPATDKLEEERKVRHKTEHTPVLSKTPTIRLFTPFTGRSPSATSHQFLLLGLRQSPGIDIVREGGSTKPLSQLGSPLNFVRRSSVSASPSTAAFSPRVIQTPFTFDNSSRSNSTSLSRSVAPPNTPLTEIQEMEE